MKAAGGSGRELISVAFVTASQEWVLDGVHKEKIVLVG